MNIEEAAAIVYPLHKLTPTQRLHEVTLAALQRRPSESEHSLTVSRNARGVVQFEVTLRGTDADHLYIDVTDMFDNLCDRYPYPATNGGTE